MQIILSSSAPCIRSTRGHCKRGSKRYNYSDSSLQVYAKSAKFVKPACVQRCSTVQTVASLFSMLAPYAGPDERTIN